MKSENVNKDNKNKVTKGKGKTTEIKPANDDNLKEGEGEFKNSGKEKLNFEGKVDIDLYTEDPTNILYLKLRKLVKPKN